MCYCNRQDRFEAPALTPEIESLDCRSFSIVSNSHAMVLFADSSAPAFLQEAVGTSPHIAPRAVMLAPDFALLRVLARSPQPGEREGIPLAGTTA